MSRRLVHLTALLTMVLGVLITVELAGSAPVELYAAVLVGAVVVGTLAAGWRMWSRCTFGVRLAAGGLAGVILAGQLLVTWQGGPGGTAVPWGPTAVAVAVAAAAVLLLTVAAPRPPERQEHPYAL